MREYKRSRFINRFQNFCKNKHRIKVRRFTLPKLNLEDLQNMLEPHMDKENYKYEFIPHSVVVHVNRDIIAHFERGDRDEWPGWRHIKYLSAFSNTNRTVYQLKVTATNKSCYTR